MSHDSVMALNARPVDGAALAGLLASNNLPTENRAASGRRFFEFTDSEGNSVGVGGLERYGEAAVFRSLVTLTVARGSGYGRAGE